MKKLLFLVIVAIVLFFVYRYDPHNGTGGEDALIKPGQSTKPLALVTGSSRGIGAQLAKLLDKKGYRVIIHGRDEQRLAAVASELNKPQILIADLATEQGRQKVIDVIKAQSPELVINNAGISGRYGRGEVLKNDINLYSKMIEVNSTALMELTYAAAKTMLAKNKKGIIVNVSSVAAEMAPLPGMTVYSASKSFVSDFSLGLDYELAGTGVRVLTNQPGTVATSEKRKQVKSLMSASEAAEEIFYQIKKRKTKYIFNRQFRILSIANKMIPNFIAMKVRSNVGMSDLDNKNVPAKN